MAGGGGVGQPMGGSSQGFGGASGQQRGGGFGQPMGGFNLQPMQQPMPMPQAPAPKAEPIKAEVRIGRNDPCPCGSGKKFKSCHGQDS
jgi:hypothetical protein